MTASAMIKSPNKKFTRGVRVIDPARDASAIVDLVSLGFEHELDPQGKKMLSQMRRAANFSAWSPLLFGPTLDPAGLVYVVEGKIVGNLSLRHAHPYSRKGQLIGNVVVHPQYQGQGIGRALVAAAITKARQQAAHWVGLEVRDDYAIAKHLYAQAGFKAVGQQYHLLRPGDVAWPNYTLPQRQWRAGTPKDGALWSTLADTVYPRYQKWVLEIRPHLYAVGGWERRFNMWLSAQRERVWLQQDSTLRLALRVYTERWYHFHVWDMLLHTEEVQTNVNPLNGSGPQELIAKALQTTRRFPPWAVIALVADQPRMVEHLYRVGFKTHRILTQMRLDLRKT